MERTREASLSHTGRQRCTWHRTRTADRSPRRTRPAGNTPSPVDTADCTPRRTAPAENTQFLVGTPDCMPRRIAPSGKRTRRGTWENTLRPARVGRRPICPHPESAPLPQCPQSTSWCSSAEPSMHNTYANRRHLHGRHQGINCQASTSSRPLPTATGPAGRAALRWKPCCESGQAGAGGAMYGTAGNHSRNRPLCRTVRPSGYVSDGGGGTMGTVGRVSNCKARSALPMRWRKWRRVAAAQRRTRSRSWRWWSASRV